ncbi:uncharacterized protein LOC130725266 [Lotus japonicus]|uniref:uncharacterized protein LOC130725266 n=1 Tax=Lotus japonicus TaxID=34305 RepID=UPI002587EC97|nr:uncharacterized protein LOC130725266 [Lotus japonicus]
MVYALDYKKHSEKFKGSKCKHSFCSDCISNHVAAQIQQNNLKVNCPEFNCGEELKQKNLQPILPKEVFDRWESVRCKSLISVGTKTYCPYKNFSVLTVDDGGEVLTSAECPSCHRLFCAQCLVPWHAGMNCEKFKKKSKSIMPKEEVLESKCWKFYCISKVHTHFACAYRPL